MIEISHHMTFLDLYLDDLLLWSSLEKDITNKELLRSAHGWVSFLFLFLDRLSRVFLLHRCTAYYVCQYNKVFAKSIGPSPMQLMSPLKLEKTRSLIISRTFQFAAFAIDVHLLEIWSGYISVWVDVATLPTNSIKFLQKNQKSKMVSSNLDQFLQLLHVSFPPGLSGTVRNKPELVIGKQFTTLSFNILILYYSWDFKTVGNCKILTKLPLLFCPLPNVYCSPQSS